MKIPKPIKTNTAKLEFFEKEKKLFVRKSLLDTTNDKRNERFINEMEIAYSMSHQNLVKVIKIDREKMFYEMPYYKNGFKSFLSLKKNCSPQKKILYFIDLCKGVQQLHNRRVVHRDLKPGNIMFDLETDSLVIIDFGIAHQHSNNLTSSSERLANFDFHAPEQRINKDKISNKTDIFALGLLLNMLFTNVIPKGTNFVEIANSKDKIHLYKLDELVNKCISYKPNSRPSINELIMSLNFIRNSLLESEEIAEEASTDISVQKLLILSDSIFERAINGEISLEKFNHNYNEGASEFSFDLDEHLIEKLCALEIREHLRNKFRYEGNVETEDDKGINYVSTKTNALYLEFSKMLPENNKIINGESLKLFRSLKDYHAKEVINSIERFREDLNYDLTNSNPMWIIRTLVYSYKEYVSYIENLSDHLIIKKSSSNDAEFTNLYSEPEPIDISDYYHSACYVEKGVLVFSEEQQFQEFQRDILMFWKKDNLKVSELKGGIIPKISTSQKLDSYEIDSVINVFLKTIKS